MSEGRNGILRRVRVLIVDDSEDIRNGLLDLCSLLYQLEVIGTASNGLEAMEAIRNLKPDVVSLDIHMPKMGGLEVLKAIKGERLICTPIVLSGMTDEFSRAKCLELGAKYVFDKTTELEKFLEILGGSNKSKEISVKTRTRARTRAGPAGKLRSRPMGKGRRMT